MLLLGLLFDRLSALLLGFISMLRILLFVLRTKLALYGERDDAEIPEIAATPASVSLFFLFLGRAPIKKLFRLLILV